MKITASDRKAVKRTMATYFETIGNAMQSIAEAIQPLSLNDEQWMYVHEGNNRLAVYKDGQEVDNSICVIDLYRMPSGRYELTWYLS